ncbi:hypothetical protein [Duganella violaceipulchra]|uniref:Uncharacterized protein n=1 Tax=Duganella violaceipulchra TaxID=2849652 RepID=A0ABT1GKC2_9BURK|nr:hypothetical protein [Duganella violaceicalia]MCP2008584.1 hypothetical protein [Duganella violaceicalia]
MLFKTPATPRLSLLLPALCLALLLSPLSSSAQTITFAGFSFAGD